MTLIYLTLAWTLGILLGRWLNPPWWALGILVACASVALWRSWRRLPARLVVGLALAALLGAGRMALAQPRNDAGDLASYNDLGHPVVLRGMVSADPERSSTPDNWSGTRRRWAWTSW